MGHPLAAYGVGPTGAVMPETAGSYQYAVPNAAGVDSFTNSLINGQGPDGMPGGEAAHGSGFGRLLKLALVGVAGFFAFKHLKKLPFIQKLLGKAVAPAAETVTTAAAQTGFGLAHAQEHFTKVIKPLMEKSAALGEQIKNAKGICGGAVMEKYKMDQQIAAFEAFASKLKGAFGGAK